MNGASFRLTCMLLVVILLAGCEAFGGKKQQSSPARVEERAVDRSEIETDVDSAVSQGLADEAKISAAALDDPNSPLSVRVIYFDYDSSAIRSEFHETIAAHAAYLASNSSTGVTLEGHADERGTREYNLALGERRALAVRRQLVLLGASAGQIKSVSYGEERPLVDGHDEQSYAQNRRVELVY
jgi:peptidoglycan-associated lipoprotein